MLKNIYKFRETSAFTLIEILLTAAIITVVILIGSNIYFSITKIQKRVATQQKVQDDARYVMEKMSQSVRLSRINYNFYNDPHGYGDYSDAYDLYPQAGNNIEILALIDQTDNNIFYRKSVSGDLLQYCTGDLTPTECDLTDGEGWQDVTPAGVKVSDLKFFIMPSADPFADPCAVTGCTINTDDCGNKQYLSYRWNESDSSCEYYTDGHNFQPKVKIVLKVESSKPNAPQAEKVPIELQTIVTSRLPASEVKNENYD